MEQSHIENRKKFFQIPEKDIQKERSKFQVSLRKKKKQDLFRQRRAMIIDENIQEATLEKTSTKILFERLITQMSYQNWQPVIEETLKLLTMKFIDTSKRGDWLEIIALPQFSKSLSDILKEGHGVFQELPDQGCLNNTEKVLEIYYSVSFLEQEEIDTFFKNSLEEKFTENISDLLIGSIKKLTALQENISSKEKQHELKYFTNIITVSLSILGNLSWMYKAEIDSDLYDTSMFKSMTELAQVIEKQKEELVSNTQITSIISMYNWYLQILAYKDDDFPLILTHHVFEYFTSTLAWIMPIKDHPKMIEKDSEFLDSIKFFFSALSSIINYKECNQLEFIGTQDLIKPTMQLTSELLFDDPKEHSECFRYASSILNSISSFEKPEIFKECEVYIATFNLITLENHKWISEIFAAIANFSKLNDAIMKTISQKDGFLFILQKAVDLSYFSVKYEAALLVEDILDINDDNEEFLDLIFTDKDTIALLQEFCMTTLLFDMKFPELITISITLFDTLFKLEDRNKHRPEISETEGFYLAKAIEENLGEKLEDFMSINSDLCVEIQEFIVKHQLITTEDWTEIAQKTNEAIFNSKFTF